MEHHENYEVMSRDDGRLLITFEPQGTGLRPVDQANLCHESRSLIIYQWGAPVWKFLDFDLPEEQIVCPIMLIASKPGVPGENQIFHNVHWMQARQPEFA